MDIEFQLFWPEGKNRLDRLKDKESKYLASHTSLNYPNHLNYALHLIKDRDFCVIKYGDCKWDYLQFTKNVNNLVMSFPWSVSLGRRFRQRDLMENLLIAKGFHRKKYWLVTEKEDTSHFYYDHTFDSCSPELIVSFGADTASAVYLTMDIIEQIFRIRGRITYDIEYGSWR